VIEEDKQRRAAEAEAAKDMLVEMEVDESFARMEEDQQRIRRRSDMDVATDGENDDGSEDEAIDSSDHEPEDSSNEELEAESESLAGDNSDTEKRNAPKVSFGQSRIQVQILTVTFRETRKLH
jgi:hypothetical protein